MTETQTLLATYAKSGSETAFRELVARYLDLVYSTAMRLADGNTHTAEDVAQTVFVDLARLAEGLSSEVADGHSQVVSSFDNFQSYEAQHVIMPATAAPSGQ